MLLAFALASGCQNSPGPAGTAPAPPLAEPGVVRIAAVGDMGKLNDGQRKVAAAMHEVCGRLGCDLVLTLGDNLYPTGMHGPDDPRMDEIAGLYPKPLYLSLGNHDYGRSARSGKTADRQVAWAARHADVHLPARYYSVSAGPHVDLWALDTNHVFWHGPTTQARWLRDGLSASTATWKIVFGHHPYRSNGHHGNAGHYDDVPVTFVSGSYLNGLFRDHLCGEADVYLAGHDHNLQHIRYCDTELVVSGAGATTRAIVDRGNTAEFEAATLGFTWLELSADAGTIVFFDGDGGELHRSSLQVDH